MNQYSFESFASTAQLAITDQNRNGVAFFFLYLKRNKWILPTPSNTHPDSSNQLRRFHVMQFAVGAASWSTFESTLQLL